MRTIHTFMIAALSLLLLLFVTSRDISAQGACENGCGSTCVAPWAGCTDTGPDCNGAFCCFGPGCGSDGGGGSGGNGETPTLACGATCYLSPFNARTHGTCGLGTSCVGSGLTGRCVASACSLPDVVCYDGCSALTPPSDVRVLQRVGGAIIHTNDIRIYWTAPKGTAWSTYSSCIGDGGFNCTRRYTLTISSRNNFDSDKYQTTLTLLQSSWTSQGIATALSLMKDNKQYYVRICAEY